MITKIAAKWRKVQAWLSDAAKSSPAYQEFLSETRIPVGREVQGINTGTANILSRSNAIELAPPEDIKPIIDEYFSGSGHDYCSFNGSVLPNMKAKVDDYFHMVPSGSKDPRYMAYGEEKFNKALDYFDTLDKSKRYVHYANDPAAVFNGWAKKFGLNKTYAPGSEETQLMDALSRRHEAYEAAETYKKAKNGLNTKNTLFYQAAPNLKVRKIGAHQNARVLTNEAKVYNNLANRDKAGLLEAMRTYSHERNLLTNNLPSNINGKLDIFGNKTDKLQAYMKNRDYDRTAKNITPVRLADIRGDMYKQLGIVSPTEREELIISNYAPSINKNILSGGNFVFFK